MEAGPSDPLARAGRQADSRASKEKSVTFSAGNDHNPTTWVLTLRDRVDPFLIRHRIVDDLAISRAHRLELSGLSAASDLSSLLTGEHG